MKRYCISRQILSYILVCSLMSMGIYCTLLGLPVAFGSVAKAQSADSSVAMDSFSKDFKVVEKNPFHEAIEFSLWEAANAKDALDGGTVDPSLTPLKALSNTFDQLVATQGVHYVEVSEVMGFEIKMEYWLKAGMFKKVEVDSGKVTSYDGKEYVVYNLGEEQGKRFSPTDQLVAADIKMISKGMLSMLAVSPFTQEEDQTIDGYDCNVFYMDMEFMGMKGNWLYVEKNTGMLIQNQYGSGKESMITGITEFTFGEFGDDVFVVPEGIEITDG